MNKQTVTPPPPLMPLPPSLASLQTQPSLFSAFPKLPPSHPTIFPSLQVQDGHEDETSKRKRPLEDATEREDPVKKRYLRKICSILNNHCRVSAAAAADRHRVLHPDYLTPFSSHEDAWQRLLSYHLFHVPSPPPNPKLEEKSTLCLQFCY